MRQGKRRNPIAFHVEPEEAWKTVVLNRWRKLCPSCFDVLAEQTRVAYRFVAVESTSWSQRPAPRNPYKRDALGGTGRPGMRVLSAISTFAMWEAVRAGHVASPCHHAGALRMALAADPCARWGCVNDKAPALEREMAPRA